MGNLAEMLRSRIPSLKIITFFHNVEYDYFQQLIKIEKKLRHRVTLGVVKRIEHSAVMHSDVIITLNRRDSYRLKDIYGRHANEVLPTSLPDTYTPQLDRETGKLSDTNRLNLVFVGSRFYPNEQAVNFFIERVIPYLKIPFSFNVIGKGFENYVPKIRHSAVNIIGKVDDLTPYYEDADFVISPIFSGSGMKTKTAEALMYGKNLLASDEALEGYDEVDITEAAPD
ncbi:glycosyltransferase [Niabella hibiscisoli]|uniref:glycosyltransferase n=1 Tax=Niabella hibiscisoli TaxID=1825928 RepID=UPI001F0F4891|nr:glycosyltransferase [Niabella hibiscisoli]MCH5719952.1 glycosyltransferase family 4 protein [Niabella hibiscisoli]